MIKSDKGRTEINGTKSGVAADLVFIVKSLMDTEIGFTKEEILKIVELASKDDDDLVEEAVGVLVKALKAAIESLKEDGKKENPDAEG